MQIKSYKFTHILFWLTIIFYMDPGGVFFYYVGSKLFGFIPYQVILTIIAYCCFIIDYNRKDSIFRYRFVSRYLIIITIWLLYYILIFIWLNNDTPEAGLRALHRCTLMILQTIIVLPIVFYTIKNINIFIYLLTRIIIVIMFLFFVSILSGKEYIYFSRGSRGFIDIQRYIIYGYVIIFFLFALSISSLSSNFKKNKPIIIAGLLAVLAMVVSVTRRHIFAIFEYSIIIYVIYNIIAGKKVVGMLKRLFSLRIIILILLLTLAIKAFSPSYIGAFFDSIENVVGQVSSEGNEMDPRLSFTKQKTIVNIIKENPFFGTGYNYLWYTSEGGRQGMEGTDYPFLGSFAMYGIIGLLILLPFYFLVIKIINALIKVIKLHRTLIYNNRNNFELPVIIGIAVSADYIKQFFEYPNWFGVLLAPYNFFLIGLLLGSYYSIKKKIIILSQVRQVQNK